MLSRGGKQWSVLPVHPTFYNPGKKILTAWVLMRYSWLLDVLISMIVMTFNE